jgi:hypothetical protein
MCHKLPGSTNSGPQLSFLNGVSSGASTSFPLVERTELEQQIAALKLQSAVLDAFATRLDQQEAMLLSEAEIIRMTGKRLPPRLLKR